MRAVSQQLIVCVERLHHLHQAGGKASARNTATRSRRDTDGNAASNPSNKIMSETHASAAVARIRDVASISTAMAERSRCAMAPLCAAPIPPRPSD